MNKELPVIRRAYARLLAPLGAKKLPFVTLGRESCADCHYQVIKDFFHFVIVPLEEIRGWRVLAVEHCFRHSSAAEPLDLPPREVSAIARLSRSLPETYLKHGSKVK